MKYLSIVAFLAMVVFFTLWSMYEDRRKQVLEEDFSTGMLQWIIEEEDDSVRTLFHGDTLEIVSPGEFTAWFDHRLPADCRITFDFSFQPLLPEDSSWQVEYMWSAEEPLKMPVKTWYRLIFTSGNTEFCKKAEKPGAENICTHFDRSFPVSPALWNHMTISTSEKEIQVVWNDEARKTGTQANPGGYFGFSVKGGRLFLTGLEVRTHKKDIK